MSVKAYWYINYFSQIWADLPAYGGWKASGGDTFKVMLSTSAYTPNQDIDSSKNSIIGEVAGQGYNAGGQTLTNKTISVSTGVLIITASDITWSNCIFNARYAVIYDDTNASPLSKQLVQFIDFGQTLQLNNQTLTLKFDGLGNVDVITSPPPPGDTTPPQIVSASINTSTLVITYNETLDTTSTPAASAYIVRVNGTAQAAPSAVVVGATTVTMTTAAPVTGGQTVALDYTNPATNPVQDVSGNDASSFLNFTVQNITVTPLVDGATFVSQSVPQSMTTSTPYSVSVVMNNSGTTSWTTGTYVLRSTNPDGNNTWGVVTVTLPQIIPPGSSCTFTFSVQSPSLAGVYSFQWMMYNGTVNFGTASTNVTVTVSAPVPPPTPTITIQSPNGGENWVIGPTFQTVRWSSSNLDAQSTLRHELSRNGGSTWETIYTGSFNDGGAPWAPTGPATTQAKWRLTSELNPAATDISDAVFTISDPITPPPPEPTAPTLSSFVAVNPTTLAWINTNVANETGYEYETAPALSGPWTVRGSATVDNTSFTWLAANPNTTYFGRVSSIGPSLTRYPSNVLQASTPPPPPPEPVAPTLISVSAPDSTSITWVNNNVANETGYDYESGPAAVGPWTLRGTRPADTTNFTWLGATQSTTYYMRVSSIGASGTRYPSNVLNVMTPATPPPPPPPEPVAPVLSSVSAPTPTSLVWNHNNVTDENGYEYYTSPPSAGIWTLRGTNPANSTTFTWSGASASTSYDMRVSSFGAAGTRYPSNTLTTTTPTPPPPEPVAPVLSTLTAPISTSLVWTHTNVANETGYEYSTALASGGPYTVRGTSVTDSTTFTWTTATPNTTYFARVASIGSSGTRYQSNVLSVTTPPTPVASLTVLAPNGGENWLVGSVQTLRWNSANLGSDTIKAELTRNNGSTYETLFPSLTNDGSENWTVTQPIGTLNKVRLTGVTNTGVTDSSDAVWTISAPSGGNAYYVSTTGSDTTGTGTLLSPWRTIRKGLTGRVAGETVYVRGGTYAESIDSNVYTIPAGTSFSAAVTLAGYQAEPVTFSGVNLVHSYIQYLIFQDLTMDGGTTRFETVSLGSSSHHVRFLRVKITRAAQSGVQVQQSISHHHEFLQCEVTNNGFWYTDSGHPDGSYFHGMYMSGSDCLTEGCLIHDNSGYGYHGYNSFGGTDQANRNIVRLNRVYRNGITLASNLTTFGVLIGSGSNNQAYNNLIYNNRGGLQISYIQSGGATGNVGYFNTIFGNGGSPSIGCGSTLNTILRNNIVYGNTGTVLDLSGVGSGFVQDHNLISGQNPLFVDSTNANFHLLAGSPAINAGVAVTGITTDFDGVTRGNPPEIGAYEFV